MPKTPDDLAASTTAGISRREFLLASAAAGASVLITGATSVTQPFSIAKKRPPNLLFINVDQLSYEAIGAHGCSFVRTPNLDRLAAQGTSFGLSYCSNPLCCPARSSWWTGRMPSETGVVDNGVPLRKDIPDMGQWLRDAGYETLHVGKWHVPGRSVRESFTVLFDGDPIGEQGDLACVSAAEGFLKNRGASTPFLLTVGLLNPHDICFWPRLHKGLRDLPWPELAEELPPLPGSFSYDPLEPKHIVEMRERLDGLGAKDWPDELWRYYIWAYYRYVEMVDGAVGRLLDALDDSAHKDNTIVIFAGDHGDGHGRHKLGLKRFLYDSASRVPLIIAAPGRLAQGLKDDRHLASSVDLAPTFCDFAGAPPPPFCHGLSLRPLLEDRLIEWRDFVAAQSDIDGRMIRTAEYKLISYRNDPVEQLFDMKNDPLETKNLANAAEHASTVEEMRALLKTWESTLENAPLDEALVRKARKNAEEE